MSTTPDFDEWVAARGPSLLRLAYVLTGSRDEAEGIVQEALSRALPRWSRISHLEDPDAHVRRMVVRATVRGRRFLRRRTPISTLVDGVATTGVVIDVRDVVWDACQSLPAEQRTAVVLRLYEDLEVEEIAALTGVREGTVRSRVTDGVALLLAEQAEENTDVDRLRDSLVLAAEQAPAPTDVARGARAKLRRRRARTARTAAVAVAALVLTALVPVGIVLFDGEGAARRPAPVLRPVPNVVSERPTANAVSERDEVTKTIFWLGITLEVPAQWQRGATTSWCSGGDDPAAVTPRVAFPVDTAAERSECTPRSGYGVIMGSPATVEPAFDARRVQQYDASADAVARYPDDAWIYFWYDDESAITVVTPDPGLTHLIAISITREELDANGCAAVYDELALPTAVGSRGVGASLCRYATDGQIEDSQRLTERETARALSAIAAAPIRSGGGECAQEEGWRVTLTPEGQAAYLALYGAQGLGSCQDGLRSTAPAEDPEGYVELTPEVLAALDLDQLR